MPAICEGCGAEAAIQRSAVRDAVRYCVDVGFLSRTDTKIGPVYQLTGQAMPRQILADTERKQCPRERDARRDWARRPARPARPSLAAAPKRSRAARVDMKAAEVKAVPHDETVEQFLARGGQVQRLLFNLQTQEHGQ